METETIEAPKRGRPAKKDTMPVLMLRGGYVPTNANVLSFGNVPTRQTGPGQFEYESVPATLEKLVKGEVVDLDTEEAKTLIKRGIACRPDEATDAQLIKAGLKLAPKFEVDDDDD
jgi:hypothetical protein